MPSVAEVLDGLGEFMGAVEAGAFEGLAGQNTEPDFDLIEP
jgi:hypothetical protein